MSTPTSSASGNVRKTNQVSSVPNPASSSDSIIPSKHTPVQSTASALLVLGRQQKPQSHMDNIFLANFVSCIPSQTQGMLYNTTAIYSPRYTSLLPSTNQQQAHEDGSQGCVSHILVPRQLISAPAPASKMNMGTQHFPYTYRTGAMLGPQALPIPQYNSISTSTQSSNNTHSPLELLPGLHQSVLGTRSLQTPSFSVHNVPEQTHTQTLAEQLRMEQIRSENVPTEQAHMEEDTECVPISANPLPASIHQSPIRWNPQALTVTVSADQDRSPSPLLLVPETPLLQNAGGRRHRTLLQWKQAASPGKELNIEEFEPAPTNHLLRYLEERLDPTVSIYEIVLPKPLYTKIFAVLIISGMDMNNRYNFPLLYRRKVQKPQPVPAPILPVVLHDGQQE